MKVARARHLVERGADLSVDERDAGDAEEGRDPEMPDADPEMRRDDVHDPVWGQRGDPACDGSSGKGKRTRGSARRPAPRARTERRGRAPEHDQVRDQVLAMSLDPLPPRLEPPLPFLAVEQQRRAELERDEVAQQRAGRDALFLSSACFPSLIQYRRTHETGERESHEDAVHGAAEDGEVHGTGD